MKSPHVLISGAGIIGLATALSMVKRGYNTTLIDEGNFDTPELNNERVYAINKSSQYLLEGLNVWLPIKKLAAPYQQMYIWDNKTKADLEFNARLLGLDCLGYIIGGGIIKKTLMDAVKDSPINLITQDRIEGISKCLDGLKIETSKQELEVSLLIIAEGTKSSTLKLLNIPSTEWSYKQESIVCTVETEKKHHHTAYQVFLNTGPLAFLPLQKQHQCSIVWSTNPTEAESLINLQEDDFNQALSKAFSKQLGACKLISQRQKFPLTMKHTTCYSGSNWLVIGDSAHSIHPMAGLGLNLGLDDLLSWLRYLDKRGQKNWNIKTLAQYHRERKYAVWQIIMLLEGLGFLFNTENQPIAFIRQMGMNVCQQFTPLKKWLIEQALYLNQKPIDTFF